MVRVNWIRVVVVVAAGIVLLPAQAEAQVKFGLKGGLAFAKLTASQPGEDVELPDLVDLPEFGSSSTFTGGAFLSIPVGGGFSFQPEALYQKRKSTLKLDLLGPGGEMEAEAAIEVTYFEVPVLLKWQLPTGGVRPAIFAGGSIGFRQSAKSRTTLGDEVTEEDIKENVKSTDFGLVVGAGLDFGKFGFEGRYTLGQSGVFIEEGDFGAVKWRTWSFLANLTF